MNFLKFLYNFEALKFRSMYNLFFNFHDKSTVNVFVIYVRSSERYWSPFHEAVYDRTNS